MKSLILIAMVASLAACTDAKIKQFTTLGDPGEITCYSGGEVIYEGKSTGKINSEQHSDGWFFEDASTHKLIRVSGDCVIKN